MATELAQSNPKQTSDPRTVRLNILAAARRVLSRDGAAAVSVESVAKEAGVSADSVAGHFKTGQELVLALAADDLAQVARSMPGEAGREKPAKSDSAAQAQPREIRKKAMLSGPLEQVMKEVAPEPEKDGVATGSVARLERRIQVMEKAFADIVERHEKSLRDRTGSLASIEESISAVLTRLDSTDKHHAEMMGEVRLALSSAAMRLNALEEPKDGPSLPFANLLPAPAPAAAPQISSVKELENPFQAGSLPSPNGLDLQLKPAKREAETDDTLAPANETYLSAARRAAKAAAVATSEPSSAKPEMTHVRRGNRAKFLLFACLAPVAILGVALTVLNQNGVTAGQIRMPVPDEGSAPTTAEDQLGPAPATSEATAPKAPQLATAASLERLTQQAEAGDIKAARDVGLKYLAGDGTGIDETEAAQWLMRAAYKGEATAEYWLGTLYAHGHGVPTDAFQANHWYEAAAKQGNRRAMHSVAVAYFQGTGKEKNFVEAARWFEKAAELGLVDSQFNLAVLYERGSGVPQSLTDAYKWYAIAAANGDKEADSRVAFLAGELRPADLALAQSAVASFKPMPMDETANAATGAAQPSGG